MVTTMARDKEYMELIKKLDAAARSYPGNNRLTDEKWGKLTSLIGDYQKNLIGNQTFRSRASYWRKRRTPWSSTKLSKTSQDHLLRAIGRLYCFIAPKASTWVLAEELCSLGNIRLISGEFVFRVHNSQLCTTKYVGVEIASIARLARNPYLFMELARFGVLTNHALAFLIGHGAGCNVMWTVRNVIAEHFKSPITLAGLSPAAIDCSQSFANFYDSNLRETFGSEENFRQKLDETLAYRLAIPELENAARRAAVTAYFQSQPKRARPFRSLARDITEEKLSGRKHMIEDFRPRTTLDFSRLTNLLQGKLRSVPYEIAHSPLDVAFQIPRYNESGCSVIQTPSVNSAKISHGRLLQHLDKFFGGVDVAEGFSLPQADHNNG